MGDQDSEAKAKQKRYDRQLRIWGAHGQAKLENCSVCLLNGSATGAETLKNLVLPGIKSFTIVDGAMVEPSDLGNNFFVDEQALGSSRAECVTKLLQEMNEHVAGSFVTEDPTQLLDSNLDFFKDFTIVIVTQLPETAMLKCAAVCKELNIPMVVVRSYGLIGYLRLALNEHEVIESHPEHAPTDLRVTTPFPDLLKYTNETYPDITQLTNGEYGHVPFVVLLLKALEQWRAQTGGTVPQNYKQKKEVKAVLETMMREDMQDPLNFAEAMQHANTALNIPSVPSSTKAILTEAPAQIAAMSDKAGSMAADLKAFWIMAAAMGQFMQAEGKDQLPMSGNIPDMTTTTDGYVKLQNVYHTAAQNELMAVQAHTQQILESLQMPEDSISIDQIRMFCKNANNLRMFKYRSMDDEMSAETAKSAMLASQLEDMENSTGATLYILLRAADAFRAQHNRWPGLFDDDVESDIVLLKQAVAAVLADLNIPASASCVKDDYIHEMCRLGAAEIHNIASVMGGVAAQEVVKIVTHQYIPMNNTFIFNGLNGTTTTLEL